jgi:16S rRNA (cytosine967-C5)-methyltransferase
MIIRRKSQISFVNAVLRNIDREGRARLEATSIIDNVNPWLAKQWVKQYGKETTHKMVEAAMSQSPVFITVNHSIAQQVKEEERSQTATSQDEPTIERLEQIRDMFTTTNDEGDPQSAELLPVGSIRIHENFGGAVSKWPLYDEGAWWVQDVSATLPAIALFNSLSGEKGEKQLEDMYVVDLCSAPGGKTAQLCSMGFGRVDAVEFSSRRSRSLHQNLKRLGMEDICNVVIADGREFVPDTTTGLAQGVLVDAPCSATGLGSRRPDVLRKKIDLKDLISIQRDLTVHAVDNILEVGGVLVYATCSLLKQEGEDQIEWLLSEKRSDTSDKLLETIPFNPGEIPGFDDCIDDNGWLRVKPGVLPGSLQFCDGFFVARLRTIAK